MAFPTGWGRRCKLTIDHTKVSSTVTDYPLVLTKSQLPSEMFDADGSYPARSDGGDIRITTDQAGTTQIPVEVYYFLRDNNPANGLAEIHCKVPSVSSSTDSEIWIWYNAPSETMPSRSSTYGSDNVWTAWNSNDGGVYHLGAGINDSSSNAHTGTNSGSSEDTGQSRLGRSSRRFVNTESDYITYGNHHNVNGDVNLCMEVQIRMADWPADWGALVGKGDTQYHFSRHEGVAEIEFCIYDTDWQILWSDVPSKDTWYSFVNLRDASTNEHKTYRNGSQSGSSVSSTTIQSTSYAFEIGRNSQETDRFGNFWIEECRIGRWLPTASYISTSNNNWSSPSTFSSAGTPESPTIAQTVIPTGIASAQAFGTAVVARGNVNVVPTGIASVVAFGVAKVNLSIHATGIPSTTAFGTASIISGGMTVLPSGIASAQVVPSPVLTTGNVNVVPTGIVSSTVFGTVVVLHGGALLLPSGITTSELVSTPTVIPGNTTLLPASISSAESVGTPTVLPGTAFIAPTGISSATVFGAPAVGFSVTVGGIASQEIFGVPTIVLGVSVLGIDTAEVFGIPQINFTISVSGIVGGESFGDPVLRNFNTLVVTGIASTEAIGSPKVILRVFNALFGMMENDLNDTFFNLTEFSETAQYIYNTGATFYVPVIFDREYMGVNPGIGADVQMTSPMAQAQASDFRLKPDKGDKIIIRGERFRIMTAEDDGVGIVNFRLYKE